MAIHTFVRMLVVIFLMAPLAFVAEALGQSYELYGITFDGKVLEIELDGSGARIVRTLPLPYSEQHYDGLIFFKGHFYTSHVGENSFVRIVRFGLEDGDNAELGTVPSTPYYHHITSMAVDPGETIVYTAGHPTSGPFEWLLGQLDVSTGQIATQASDMVLGNDTTDRPWFWGMNFRQDGRLVTTSGGRYIGTRLDSFQFFNTSFYECTLTNSYDPGGLPASEWISGISRHPLTNVLYGVSGYFYGGDPPFGLHSVQSTSNLYILTNPSASSFCSGTYPGGVKSPVQGDETPVLIGSLGITGISDITFVDLNQLPCEYYKIGNTVVCF